MVFEEIAVIYGRGHPVRVEYAVGDVSTAIQDSRVRSGKHNKTIRTKIICPGVDIRGGLFEHLGSEAFYFKAVGMVHDKVTRKRTIQMWNALKTHSRKSKIIRAHDSGVDGKDDNMTGLDISLNWVITIGRNQNYAQSIS